MSDGEQGVLVAVAAPRGGGADLGQQGGAGIVGLLRLLLGVLAGARGGFNPGAGSLGSLDLCRVVGQGLYRQFPLIALGVGDAESLGKLSPWLGPDEENR